MPTCQACGLPVFRQGDPNWAPTPCCQAHVSDKLLIGCRDRQRKHQASRIAALEAIVRVADEMRESLVGAMVAPSNRFEPALKAYDAARKAVEL